MRPNMRMTQVYDAYELSPHMRRITLFGDELSSFPAGKESAHVKVIIPQPGKEKPAFGLFSGAKKWMRSYTVRFFDSSKGLLTIDFAINDHDGPIANWAARAKKGDYLGIAGPGSIKHTDFNADWHLIAGDLTALPAIAATIEKLPTHAKGYVFIQIPTAADQQDIKTPEHLQLQWIINRDTTENALFEKMATIDWLKGEPAIFIAGESSQVKALRRHVKSMPGYTKNKLYASGYWRA